MLGGPKGSSRSEGVSGTSWILLPDEVIRRGPARACATLPTVFQGATAMSARETVLEDSAVVERLGRDLPRWTFEEGWIKRTYKTNSWKGTLMVVNAVGHLAEAAWHHPDITLSYAWLEVRLTTHTAKGVTEKDLALAKKIEEVVAWQPGLEGGALEGTPTDPRFAYIKYER
jgi:4a-hydroxytetrahydrobiopterin dehydratase